MKDRKPGKRHQLLIYRRTMDRLWQPTLFLGLLLGAAWAWIQYSGNQLFPTEADGWLLIGSVVTLAIGAFAFLARSMAYVQAYPTYLRVATPFLRLNISYRRIRSAYPTSFQQLFPPGEAGWAERRFLEPFYPKTAVVLELSSFPIHPNLLRLFLARQIFSRRKHALICVVQDWMGFSTELDSHFGSWQQAASRRQSQPGHWK